jgi:hypothetical protein
MDKLYQFYENELGGTGFYSLLMHKTKESTNQFNQNIVFNNTDSSISKVSSDVPKVNNGDIRIDMPILCGNIKSQRKVLFLGLEPRHTDDIYNIMKIDNKVFATPFGIDKWNSKSKQSIYARAFENFLKLDALFLFSDFVKEYKVIDALKKTSNDQQARSNFKTLFDNRYKSILEQEIKLFEPTLIIGLGKGDISRKVPKTWLNEHNVKIISHPTNGNFNRMQSELAEILK